MKTHGVYFFMFKNKIQKLIKTSKPLKITYPQNINNKGECIFMANKKIILSIICLFLIIGAAYAAQEFKIPTDLHKISTSSYVDEKGHNLDIQNYSESSYKTWFENDTGYLVQKYKDNDSFYLYADSSAVDPNKAEAVGILEIVEHDGNKYIINSWTPKEDKKDMDIIWENLLEFNKLNKLTPTKI